MMTFIYLEYQQVHIKCLEGFKLFGESNLTCGINGFFNHEFPICEGRNLYCSLPNSENVFPFGFSQHYFTTNYFTGLTIIQTCQLSDISDENVLLPLIY